MKKFIYCLLALFALCITPMFTSCNKCEGGTTYVNSIQYNLTAEGQADGQFGVAFPQGQFDSNGNAELRFTITSAEPDALELNSTKKLETALASKDAKEYEAALRAEDFLDKVYISSADGHYLIHVKGYVKEPITGLTFVIDRTYTNKEPDTLPDIPVER